MTVEYKVPRLLWENLESVLLAQSRRYIGELAKHLGVPEKELQKRVLPTSDSLKIILQDSQAESNQCRAYVQEEQMTIFCKKPVAYHSEYCTFHRHKRMLVIDGTNPTIVQKVKDRNTVEPMWLHDKILLNAKGLTVGQVNTTTNTIKIFQIEE